MSWLNGCDLRLTLHFAAGTLENRLRCGFTIDRLWAESMAIIPGACEHTGPQEHDDNWLAPGSDAGMPQVAVRSSAEEVGIADAVARAELAELGAELKLRVATPADLVMRKLAAAAEPRYRSSKRQHDVGDVVVLLEEQAP